MTVTSNSISLTWSAVIGANVTYVPQIALAGTGDWTSLPATALTMATFTGLEPATAYDLDVYAQEGTFAGPESITLTVTTLPPSAPSIAIDAMQNIASATPFVVSGTLSNYTEVPQLSYSDDAGQAFLVPPDASTSLTLFSFTHPAQSIGLHSIDITDANGVDGSLVYDVVLSTTTPPAVPSEDNTVVITVGPSIIDTNSNTWTLNQQQQVVGNGVIDQTTTLAVQLAYVEGVVYYQRSDLIWLRYTGSSWVNASNPFATQPRDVLSRGNDLFNTGLQVGETILTVTSASSLRLLNTVPVDDYIYARPLYIWQYAVGSSAQNVSIVCTANNSVYMINVDTGAVIWISNLGQPVPSVNYGVGYAGLYSGNNGILSTPAIDRTNDIIYVCCANFDHIALAYSYNLHALDMQTGSDVMPPSVISGSNQGVTFAAQQQLQRASLTLHPTLNQIYIGFSDAGQFAPFYGWLFVYNAATIQQIQTICLCPGGGGACFMSSGAPIVDEHGVVYISTGNGIGSVDETQPANRANSIIQFFADTAGLQLFKYYTDPNWATIDISGDSVGQSNLVMAPGSNILISGYKSGIMAAVDRTQLRGIAPPTQEWQPSNGEAHGLAYFNGSLYVGENSDSLKAFAFNGSAINTMPASQSNIQVAGGLYGTTGFDIAVSSSAVTNGIVWCSQVVRGNAGGTLVNGMLLAFDATNLTSPLWTSYSNQPRDDFGIYAKWVPPTIGGGKVIMATNSLQVCIYGLSTVPQTN